MKKILIVDDESDITLTFKIALESSIIANNSNKEFEVDVYNDPEQALSNFKPHYYHLALLDIRMPKMNGYQLYHALRSKDNNINIAFLTASESFEDFEQVFPTLNENQFIKKPIENKDLIKRVNELMGST